MIGLLLALPAFAHVDASLVGIDVAPPAADGTLVLDASFGLLISPGGEPFRWVCHESITSEGAIQSPRYARNADGVLLGFLSRLDQARDPAVGLYRSADGCDWGPVEGLDNRVISALRFDPDDSSRAIVGTAHPAEGVENAILYSGDAGQTWSLSDWNQAGQQVTGLVAPGGGMPLWASANAISGDGGGWLLRSFDGGRSWSRIAVSYGGLGTGDEPLLRILAASPTDPETAWVVLEQLGPDRLLHTTDAGASFEPVLDVEGDLVDGAVDASGAVWVVEAPEGLHRAADGRSFQRIEGAPPAIGVEAVGEAAWITGHAEFTGGLLFEVQASGEISNLLDPVAIEGPLSCPTGTEGADICEPLWDTLQARLEDSTGGGDTGESEEPEAEQPETPRRSGEPEGGCGSKAGFLLLLPVLCRRYGRRPPGA